MAFVALGLLGASAGIYKCYKSLTSSSEDMAIHKELMFVIEAAWSASNLIEEIPTILVVGFQHHGKSSFINSVFRVVYGETGAFLRRAETGPPCDRETTLRFKIYHVENPLSEARGLNRRKKDLFKLVDSPPFCSMDEEDVEILRKVLHRVDHNSISKVETENPRCRESASPNCVFIIINAVEAKRRSIRLVLQRMARTIRDEGLSFVVILSHKDKMDAMSMKQLMNEVAAWCSNDSVYCLENYVQPPSKSRMERKIDIHLTILQILRQGLELSK